MKFNKKLFSIFTLIALLLALFTTSAFAASTRIVRPAQVTDLKVLDDQPATFRLRGTYTCDFVEFKSEVSGKTITLTALDTKVKYTGTGCDTTRSFRRDINVGTLVPGVYTVIVNPNANGKGQKVIKGFIAPPIATSTPMPAVPVP